MPSTWRWNSLKSVARPSVRAAKPSAILPVYCERDRAEIERGSLLALKGQQKMLYVVLFEDEPSRTTMRAQHMSDHLAFLERNAHSVRSAGPLVDAVDESGAGGLWLVEAENLQGCRHSTSQTRFGRQGCANPSGCCDGTRSSLTAIECVSSRRVRAPSDSVVGTDAVSAERQRRRAASHRLRSSRRRLCRRRRPRT